MCGVRWQLGKCQKLLWHILFMLIQLIGKYLFQICLKIANEHLLSYGFWKFCQADNVGFHMTEEMVTIDLNREVSAAEVLQVETLANAQIQENLPIKTTWMDATQAAVCATRKFNDKLTGPVRVVSIEGSDACTCCGTHPPTTGRVGLVKVFKMEKHKEGTRIYFLCGRLAMEKIQKCW